MQSLSCAYTGRSSARLGKRRSALHNAPLCGAAQARIAGSWQSGACYVQRAENSCALAFFFHSSVSVSPVSLSLSRTRAPVPIEFPADSFRLLWPIVQKTDRGSAVSFSHLVALISRRDPLHNVHLCRPAERYRDRKRTGWTPTVTFLRVSPFSFIFYRFPPSSCPTVCNMFSSIPRILISPKCPNDHEYGTIAVTQMFAAVRGHNLQRLSYVTACR